MNTSREPFSEEERRWAERLAQLPAREPSACLDARIQAMARSAQRPRRRAHLVGWGLGASAAALLCIAVLLPVLREGDLRQPVNEFAQPEGTGTSSSLRNNAGPANTQPAPSGSLTSPKLSAESAPRDPAEPSPAVLVETAPVVSSEASAEPLAPPAAAPAEEAAFTKPSASRPESGVATSTVAPQPIDAAEPVDAISRQTESATAPAAADDKPDAFPGAPSQPSAVGVESAQDNRARPIVPQEPAAALPAQTPASTAPHAPSSGFFFSADAPERKQLGAAQDQAAAVPDSVADTAAESWRSDPQAWLRHIQQLLRDGHEARARAEWREFRVQHPQLPVPPELARRLDPDLGSKE